MKTKKYTKICIAAILLMAMMVIIVTANGDAQSPWTYYTVNGNNYSAVNALVVTSTDVKCYTDMILNNNLSNIASGLFGTYARIYENSILVKSGSWNFNLSGKNSVSSVAILIPPIKGRTYIAKGLVQMWNGSAYSQYEPQGTGGIVSTNSTGSEINNDFEININGQTYGSALNALSEYEMPTLILAMGLNGNLGYVYANDLEKDTPNNPEEAVEYMKRLQEMNDNGIYSITIPLYDVDGETVIDEFEISIDVSADGE